MDSLDPSAIDALRREGLTYSEIGQRLGTTKDAARGIHTRWIARRDRHSELPDHSPYVPPSVGGAAGSGFVSPPVPAIRPGSGGRGDSSIKSEINLARATIARVTRAEVRLKHSVLADVEINELLAQRLIDFDKAVQSGIIPTYALELVVGDAAD